MATISIKQNNINFTVNNTNTPKSWTQQAGATFSPSDLGTNFDLNILKQSETEGWLNDLRVLHGLFIDWDSGKITLNGTTYTITNTGELLYAIQRANQTYGLGNYSGKLSTQAFTNKYNELLNRINNLPTPTAPPTPVQKYNVYYYDAEFGGIKINEDPKQVTMGQVITLWPAYGEDENYRFVGWKNKAKNYTYKAGAQVIVTPSIISGSDIDFYAIYEENISYTYVEPEPEEINDAYVTFGGYDTISGSFTGGSVSEGRTITLPSAGKNSTSQYSYTFNGWKNELDDTIYQAGSTVTIWTDTNFTAQFIATTQQYTVNCYVTNGHVTTGGPTRTIGYGSNARFTISPNTGYQLPTGSFNGGHMEGNVAVSNSIKGNTNMYVICPEAPISYTYVEPEQEPEYVFSINDNYDTIAWNGTKTVTATLTNGSASNTKWTLSGDTQYATISSSTGSSTKVTANNTAVNSQSTSIAEPTIAKDGVDLKCLPGKATTTTYGANKSVILKATNSNATSGSPQSCIINIQAKPESSVTVNWSSIDWYIVSGSQYASLSNNGTTCKVTNNNHSGSAQVIKVRCVVYYGSAGSKSKDYTFNVPNIEEETSYTYVG